MTDVLLRQTSDGGDITVEAGLFLLSEGLETAAFLSLFGGNEQDPVDSSADQQWWGNLGEVEPARIYRSETQYLLRSLAAIPANLRRVEQAAARDLQWMIDTGVAKSIAVVTSMPALNRIRLDVEIITLAEKVQLSFG